MNVAAIVGGVLLPVLMAALIVTSIHAITRDDRLREGRTTRRNCRACRDDYPVSWIDAAPSGRLRPEQPLCRRHLTQWQRIKRLEIWQ